MDISTTPEQLLPTCSLSLNHGSRSLLQQMDLWTDEQLIGRIDLFTIPYKKQQCRTLFSRLTKIDKKL